MHKATVGLGPGLLIVLAALAAGCHRDTGVGGAAGAAAPATIAANAALAQGLELADRRDFEDAARGLIARPSGKILAADGTVLKDFDAWGFLQGPAPDTVNPSLWRHALLDGQTGLFKVTDGVYQLRGFDLANMSLIEGKTGWIVVDPLTSRESAAAAIAFARQHLGDRPVSAVIFTHSHIDHFGGVLGVVSAQDAQARHLPVVAPAGFIEEATSENVLVGLGMGRRSTYQFGKDLPLSARGFVDNGLGKEVVYGTFGILQPTESISQESQALTLDGVRFVFHYVPDSEAPAEMSFEVPERKAYCSAELVTQTMHNLLPLRGSKVRDALRWSEYLDQALGRLDGIEVLFASHTWPAWGHERIAQLVKAHRDLYRYTHDQTVRLINAGYTLTEIADRVHLPKSLAAQLGARGYYGDLRHNVGAVYQFYMGYYDGNPVHLDPLPPDASAPRYVALMGGADKVVAAARAAYDKGDYRWAAELLDRVVFAEPGHAGARRLLADVYDQMGYLSESASFRNSYLTGAQELRQGTPAHGVDRSHTIELLAQTPVERFLDAMAGALDGPAADGVSLKINLVLTDTGQSYVLWIENAVLHHRAGRAGDADATLSLTKPLFLRMMAGTARARDMFLGPDVKVGGSRLDLVRFFSLFTRADGAFAIVTP